MGYKIFELRAGPGTASRDPAATFAGQVLQNSRVKLTLERDGALASLVDLRDPATELAAAIDGLKVNDIIAHNQRENALGPALVVENSGSVSVTIRAESDSGRHHVTRTTLYRDSERIDLRNEIEENFGDVRHWAFSFKLSAPDVHTEEVGAILRLKKQSDGGHYAERNARYDYATLNHFADIADGANACGITLSNWDCAFMRLGNSKPDSLDTTTAQLHVLAGGQIDGDQLGIREQNGATHFLQRFALRPHRGYDPVAAMRSSPEHQNPPVTGTVRGEASAPLPGAVYSLLSVSDPAVLLWALKPAEEGIERGIVTRWWNVADRPVAASNAFASGLRTAHATTHLETDLAPVALDASSALPTRFSRQQLQTFRLRPR